MIESRPFRDEDGRLHRMLLAHVRQEFEVPVGAILGYTGIMLEDAEERGHHSILGDLRRLHQAGLKLKELVSGLLDPNAAHSDFVDFRRNLRHDLRTPITAIKGFGEMLLEDAEDETLAHDLKKLLDATARLLAQIDTLVDFTATSLPASMTGNSKSVAVSAVFNSVRSLSTTTHVLARPSRILIVDDTDATRELLSRRFAREGHHIVEANNGRAALERVAAETFDLVLLDMIMPDISGYEVLKRLKADARLRHIPIIVISALDEIDSIVRGIEAGAEDYLSKPFDPVLLRARIGASLEKTRLREREQGMVRAA